jgi:hypothetical protein
MPQDDPIITESTVARIDERTKSIQTELVQIRVDIRDAIENLVDRVRDVEKRHGEKMEDIVEQHVELVKEVRTDYVKKSEFALIQKIVYGFVGIIITSVVVALLATVIIQPQKSERVAPTAFTTTVK